MSEMYGPCFTGRMAHVRGVVLSSQGDNGARKKRKAGEFHAGCRVLVFCLAVTSLNVSFVEDCNHIV